MYYIIYAAFQCRAESSTYKQPAAKVGLKINEQRTKYLIATRIDTTIRDVGQSVAIGDKHFEVVK
jgi:hypothetical protein